MRHRKRGSNGNKCFILFPDGAYMEITANFINFIQAGPLEIFPAEPLLIFPAGLAMQVCR
jgi:hypothetical protein